jgi:cyanate permease
MNMVGNLGGVVSTAVVPFLVHLFGWMGALACASIAAFIAAAFWLLIYSEPKMASAPLSSMAQASSEAN